MNWFVHCVRFFGGRERDDGEVFGELNMDNVPTILLDSFEFINLFETNRCSIIFF